jgi:hypothetical protein
MVLVACRAGSTIVDDCAKIMSSRRWHRSCARSRRANGEGADPEESEQQPPADAENAARSILSVRRPRGDTKGSVLRRRGLNSRRAGLLSCRSAWLHSASTPELAPDWCGHGRGRAGEPDLLEQMSARDIAGRAAPANWIGMAWCNGFQFAIIFTEAFGVVASSKVFIARSSGDPAGERQATALVLEIKPDVTGGASRGRHRHAPADSNRLSTPDAR